MSSVTAAYLISQRWQVVDHNRRGASDHPGRHQFPLQRKNLGQAVKDQLDIELTGNGHIETTHKTTIVCPLNLLYLSFYVYVWKTKTNINSIMTNHEGKYVQHGTQRTFARKIMAVD
jgi:hypothetical protein